MIELAKDVLVGMLVLPLILITVMGQILLDALPHHPN
jgi:hypothetical protein